MAVRSIMGSVTILPETTTNPITVMGERAGVCWGSDITDPRKNYRRGLECLERQHGRVFEFVNVEMVLDGYSARVIREWYTHLGGSPTRLQASTRYVDYKNFDYVTPPSISKDKNAQEWYDRTNQYIAKACRILEAFGVPREDVAMLLPLGMATTIVDKRNLRNLIDMSHQRMCSRAYWEFRELFKDISTSLKAVSHEWEYIVDNFFVPKCELTGICPERNGCGRYPGL